jgi:hypothetical protein
MAVGVATTVELTLAGDEDTSVDVAIVVCEEDGADDEELLVTGEVEDTEGLTTLAPQTEGTFAAGPTVDLR